MSLRNLCIATLVACLSIVGLAQAQVRDTPKAIPVEVINVAGASPSYLQIAEQLVAHQINTEVAPVWHTPPIQFVTTGAQILVIVTDENGVMQLCGGTWLQDVACHYEQGNTRIAVINRYWTPSLMLDHELIESLVDPTGHHELFGLTMEPCDPVDATFYRVRRMILSDFVYPSWFSPHGRAPYDLLREIHQPRRLGHGGYDPD